MVRGSMLRLINSYLPDLEVIESYQAKRGRRLTISTYISLGKIRESEPGLNWS